MIITNADKWDRREFSACMESMPALGQAELEGTKKVHNYAEFMFDVFAGMYKYNPKVRDEKTVPLGESWSYKIFDQITKLPEWQSLRARTRLHPEASAAATADFCIKFLDAVPEMRTKDPARLDTMAELMDESTIRSAARAACASAAKTADQTTEMLDALGFGTGDGRPHYAAPGEKKEVAKRLYNNETLRRIAEMAGRMRRIAAQKQKTKTRHGVDELTDITVGDDLSRLIPAEIAKLAHPTLKMDFYKRFIEKNLVQYKLRGKEKQGKGPIVACVDESGSMQGDKDVWAKAVALALLQIAQQQKRDFALIHFDGRVRRVDKFSNKTDPAAVMDAVAHFSGGGTDFMQPLNEAVQIITKSEKFKDADIIFITDGESTITDDWLRVFAEFKAKSQTRVTSVLIAANPHVCKYFSDQLVSIDNLNDDGKATDALFTI